MFYFSLDMMFFRFYNETMITIAKDYKYTSTYDLARLGDPEKLLFFDIETTGLSSKRDMVYLIGCVYLRDGSWHLKQWFADSPEAEKEVLLHFFLFSSRFSTLVHFNGTTFDLPFLKERASKFGTPLPEKKPESFDIYKKVRSLKTLLDLPDCKQKTLEAFLGTGREDPYDGGQLIGFYWQYLRTKEERLYQALLLHNAEDIMGLPSLLSILSYRDFFSDTFRLLSEELRTYRSASGSEEQELFLVCESGNTFLPAPCSVSCGDYRFSCRENRLTVRLPLYSGSLRYFFPNYTDYYYLPEEDRSIHKSIAFFVDKGHRKKATAKTCYQNHTGLFVPFPEKAAGELPLFYTEYKKQPAFLEYRPGLFEDSSLLQQFLLATLPF